MRLRASWFAALPMSVLLCLVYPAHAQDVTIDFTGVANTNVQVLGAYAGYYTGTVTANGVTTAANPGFICDDYNNEIFLPSESWQATATSFASLATSASALNSTFFGSTIGQSGYAAIAYLANLMSVTPASGQADISAAIWFIGSLNSTNPVPFSSLDATAQGYVNYLLGDSTTAGLYDGTDGFSSTADTMALSELESSSLWLYTPTGQDIDPAGDPTPQEFVANVAVLPVPEGGAPWLYLLLAAFAFCRAVVMRRGLKPVRIIA